MKQVYGILLFILVLFNTSTSYGQRYIRYAITEAEFWECIDFVQQLCANSAPPNQLYPYYADSTGQYIYTPSVTLPPPELYNGLVSYAFNCYYTNPAAPGPYPNTSTEILQCTYNPAERPNPDLEVNSVEISQDGAVVEDGLLALEPTKTATIKVKITGRDVLPDDTRQVTLKVVAGPEVIIETLPISHFQGSLTRTYQRQLPITALGYLPITATINEFELVPEADYTNNKKEAEAQVNCDVKRKGRVVQHWYQGQLPWGPTQYANSRGSMGGLGCAVTSEAMLLDSYGLKTDVSALNFDPGTLNDGLKGFFDFNGNAHSGYDHKNGVVHTSVALYGQTAFMKQCLLRVNDNALCLEEAKNKVKWEDYLAVTPQSLAKAAVNLCAGNPIVLKVPGLSDPKKDHFVLATGTSVINKQLVVKTNDPARGENFKISPEDIKNIVIFQQTKDPAMIYVRLDGDAELILTDPSGKRIGKSVTGNVYNEIPSGYYGYTGGIEDLDLSDGSDDSLEAHRELYLLQDVLTGEYQIEIQGISDGSYDLYIQRYDANGQPLPIITESGTLAQNEIASASFTQFDEQPEVLENASLKTKQLVVLERPKKTEDRFIWAGQIVSIDGRNLQFDEKMELKINGVTAIAPLTLNEVRLGRFRTYWYKSKNAFITIDSRGHFLIHLKDVSDLNSTDISLEFNVGDHLAVEKIQLKCRKRICTGK